jgi:hypothetical protein
VRPAATCLVLDSADFSLAKTAVIAEAGAKSLARFEGFERT